MTKKRAKYIPKDIEQLWQQKWRKEGIYNFKRDTKRKTYYTLVELPYPSGDLHLGHWFTFANADVHARLMRMKGYNVFFPIGFDAFGLPAENAAIKRNIHPKDWTMKNIQTMIKQFETMGTSLDWPHNTITCLPEYYTWNQWIFLKMWQKGVAYRGKTLSNWCPVDQTVLANEHVENGRCWRCGSIVEQKEVEQWFLKITDYADELLWHNSDQKISNNVDWPQSVREGQNSWIGRSEGTIIKFQISNFKFQIEAFTTRPDTLYGATFMVLAPEHPFVASLLKSKIKSQRSNIREVEKYVQQAKRKTEMERKESREKTGVFSGAYAINPINNQQIPIWIADYVLLGYGTGAIMAVPAHDERDFEFAKKYDLPVKPVIAPFRNVITLHGCPPDEKSLLPDNKRWMWWLESQLKEQGIDAVAPHMPIPWEPSFDDWKKTLEQYQIDQNTILIGHSCGAAFLVQWLQETKRRIKKLVLVAPAKIPEKPGDKRGVLYEFTLDPKVRECIGETVIFISNDAERHLKAAKMYQEALGARVIELKDKGHFIIFDMKTVEFPEILEELLDIKKGTVTSGRLINSEAWNGWIVPEEIGKVITWLEEKGLGTKKINYHLHDWSVSRQRYWGTPVPMIHCDNCGIVPVPEKDLPVELPYEVDYTPKGKPPLATAEEWLNVACPTCGGEAKRDAETLDTFFDSSWYYYRYLDPNYDKGPFDRKLAEDMMPVDIYFGGAEHTLGHTLYARFFTKFFKDLGYISFDEFAKKRLQHGVILGPDGYRMSKSRGNVVNPDDVVSEYGADTVRLYLSFMMPFDATTPWNSGAISGIYRFLKRIWQLQEKLADVKISQEDKLFMHKTIKKVGEDIEDIKFNTAVASLMEWLNHLSRKEEVSRQEYKTLLLLLAPFAPHITEQLWQMLNTPDTLGTLDTFQSVHLQSWPRYDEQYLQADIVAIAVQVNGKLRDTIKVQSSEFRLQSSVEEVARQSENVKRHIGGKNIKKVIYVPGKIINFVVN